MANPENDGRLGGLEKKECRSGGPAHNGGWTMNGVLAMARTAMLLLRKEETHRSFKTARDII
jgi:hypothetical protein